MTVSTHFSDLPIATRSHLSVIPNQPQSLSIHPSVHSLLKRGVDVVGALVGLGITGVLSIPIAIAITLDSPGSIFYSQMRCGLYGQRFRIWKFRSMVTGADAQRHLVSNQAKGHWFKNHNDARITPIGGFLRRTSLDELPQFWNVLKGEMSLVGTRPPTEEEVIQYHPHHWQRLAVKPGMTGLWQVSGRSKITDFEQVVHLDLRYQRRWSLVYDLQLIAKTLWALVRRDCGAC